MKIAWPRITSGPSNPIACSHCTGVLPWRRTISRLLGIGRRDRRDAELREEIDAHLALIEDEYRRDGLSEGEARARARRTFGNVTVTRERTADTWSFPRLETFLQDVRYAARMIRRAPGLSLVVIGIVAITIAASTALYTLADACIMHAIRYPVTDRWVAIRARKPEQRTFQNFSSVPELMDLERLTDVFETVGAIIGSGFTTSDGEFPEHVDGTRVTASGINLTGVPPLFGRTFTEAEDQPGGPAVVVLSYELWQRKYNGDRGVLGRPLSLDGVPHSIIGVMPPHFSLWGGDVWVPLQLDRAHLNRDARQYWIIAVLRRGVTERWRTLDCARFAEQMASDYRLSHPAYARYETWGSSGP